MYDSNPVRFMRCLLPCFCLFLLGLTACKKDEEAVKKLTISGTVVNDSSVPMAGVELTLGTSNATTGADGAFVFNDVDSKAPSFQLTASKDGYFPAYSNVDNLDGSSMNCSLVMLAKTQLGTIPASGGQVSAPGIRVTAPAGAFRKADGSTYSGPVTVSAKYVSANDANIARAMPGGDLLATNAAGTEGGMRSYGFTATAFVDGLGNALTPTATVKVGITLPAGTPAPATTGAKAWAYNPATGKWSGEAAVTMSGQEVFMPCITLYQNLDAFVQYGTLTGTVLCSDGQPAAGVEVVITLDPYNKYVTKTNENGKYRAKVEATTVGPYTVAAGGQRVSLAAPTQNATVTAGTITTSNCTPAGGGGGGGGGGGNGSGSFTVNGQSYAGLCGATPSTTAGCTGINVVIVGTGASFVIYNMPQQSSGSYPIADGYQNNSTCNLWAGTTTGNASASGTVTKTGARSFTFTCIVQDLLANRTYPASGAGTW